MIICILTGLGRPCSRLWSENFDDDFFYTKLEEWINTGIINHDVSYLKPLNPSTDLFSTPAGEFGKSMGEYVLKHKEIMGLFDMYCMGMMNGVFPQAALSKIGMPMEKGSPNLRWCMK